MVGQTINAIRLVWFNASETTTSGETEVDARSLIYMRGHLTEEIEQEFEHGSELRRHFNLVANLY